MLKIWYYANIEYMKDAPSYFDNVYEDEWIEEYRLKKGNFDITDVDLELVDEIPSETQMGKVYTRFRMWIIAQLSVHMLLTVLYWEP